MVEKILGYTPQEIMQKYFFDLFHPEDREASKAAALAAFAAKQPFREFINRNVHKNGQTIWLSTSALPLIDDNGNLLGYRGADTDITERKQVVEKLEEERILLRTLIDNLPDRIYVKDVQGYKIISNSADWLASGAKSMEDVIGKTDREVYPPELAEDYCALDEMVIDSGISIINREEPGLDSQGNSVQILTSKVPLRDGDGWWVSGGTSPSASMWSWCRRRCIASPRWRSPPRTLQTSFSPSIAPSEI
jgi:PAS domain S-box-containing protein